MIRPSRLLAAALTLAPLAAGAQVAPLQAPNATAAGSTGLAVRPGLEVFAQYELDEATEYPGGSELTFAAQDECQSRFEAYVGHSYWTSELDLTTLTPSFSTWDVGDRTVTCLLVAGDGSMLAFAARNASR